MVKKIFKLISLVCLGVLLSAGAAMAVTVLSVPQGGTGAGTLTGILKGNGTSAFTVATPGTDYLTGNQTITLSGDITGSGATGITTSYNGTVPFGKGGTGLTTAADDTTLVSSGAAWVASALPNCTDATGNHLNYTASTNSFSCGTSSSGGGGLTVASTSIASGANTKVLFDNSGTLGEYTISGSGNVAMTTSPVFTTPNIGVATGSISGNAGTVTGATFTTGLTVNTGTVTLTGNVANTSVLTIGAGAVSVSGSNTGDNTSSNLLPLNSGGTNANLTASNGGIFYSTGSAGAILAGTATASKMLLSGSSTTPTWSTSTIPTSAGATANKLLLSDGTNYALSTPTFPNASATSGKTIRSDGTNWIASTATLSDAPSTALKWLRSDGTNWITSTSTLSDSPGTASHFPVSDGTNWITSAGLLSVASAKTLTASNTLTLAGTDGTTMTFPASSATVAGLGITQTFTGINTFTPAARSSGVASYLTINAPADTGQTTATESIGLNVVGATRTWVDGTVATQREYLFQAPTYNKTTTSATFTKAGTLVVSAAPIAGTGVTITNPYAFWVQAGGAQFDGGLTSTTVNATTGFQISGAASSGKILIGNGTNFVASTPTYPNASATAGKIMISDGTNFVASTPTYPNASATTRKILVSDGTNFVASTETYAVPGTSGNVLTSDGTNWTSAAASSGGKFGGNGSDGALSISSGTTTIDCASAAVCIKNYTSISITGTAVLTFINPNTNGTIIILKSQGAVTVTASGTSIDASGMGAAGTGNASPGSAGSVGSQPNSNVINCTDCAGGGANANSSATAGVAGKSKPRLITTKVMKYGNALVVGAGGGGGAASASGGTGTATGGAGSNGGGGLMIECAGAFNFTTGTISAAGKTGGAGTNGTGNTGNSGGGGGGGGGFIQILYTTLTANSGTLNVNGGAGGAAGTGQSGTASSSGGGGASQINDGTVGTSNGGPGGSGGTGWTLAAVNTEFQ